MIVNEYYEGMPKDGSVSISRYGFTEWHKKCDDLALKACSALVTMSRKNEVDIQKLSMISMFCIMHNLAIIVKDISSDFAVKRAKNFKPVMNKFAARWPFAREWPYV
jgi:hypothetical protein